MESMRRPMERLVESLSWFVIAKEVALLHVVADSHQRIQVLEHVAAAEHHSLNETPFVILEAPFVTGNDGWNVRIEELGIEMAEVRKALAKGGAPIDPDAPTHGSNGQTGLRGFGLALGEEIRSLPSPLKGLTVVLAPMDVNEPSRWASDLWKLLNRRELEGARFIVVGDDSPQLQRMRERLDQETEIVDARVDPEEAKRDMEELLAAMASAPAGASGHRAMGAAGPGVSPPPRKNTPPTSVEQQRAALSEAGIPEALADPELGKDLRGLVFGAAQAISRSDPVEAIRLLRQAIEQCLRSGLFREAVAFHLMLGTTVLQLGRPEAALPILEEAKKQSIDYELGELEVQALITIGLALCLCKRIDEAASAYEQAGRAGASYDKIVLAIEGYRLCGQLLFTRNRIEPAILAWKKALELAEAAPPEVASASSAPQVARTLAEACRRHGLTSQADSLDVQAAAFEAPQAGEEALPPPQQPKQSVTQTMEMIIDDLFLPQEDPSAASYNPSAESPVPLSPPPSPEYPATVVLSDLSSQTPPQQERTPVMAFDSSMLISERPSRFDRSPTMQFDVSSLQAFALPQVDELRDFQPSFQAAGTPLIDEASDLFAPVEMSQFKRDPKYAPTVPLDVQGNSAGSSTPPVERSLDPSTPIGLPRAVNPVIRAVHSTDAKSLELDALVLPDDFEPPPFDEDEE